ncbi:MAG: ligT like phosphoesterase [Clostridia bacterium]|nr:ligT like phosphoesterase [Clostridia bacterium]
MKREDFLSFDLGENMSSYEGFDNFMHRILSFQKPDFHFGVERFVPSGSIPGKVREDRSFSTFVGDTVVFNLSEVQKKIIFERYIKPLYEAVPHCFAEMLQEHTLHMTLHDLNASAVCDYDVTESMFETEVLMARLIEALKVKPQTISMITTCAFNMVNTSLVLGLRPATEDDYEKLMDLYCHVDKIRSLPYPFTPHITLAYFNREGFGIEEIRRIEHLLTYLNKVCFEVPLSTESLVYQKFISMNDYFNVLPFVK